MGKRITIIQGHPDGQARHFCHALADEYAKECEDGGLQSGGSKSQCWTFLSYEQTRILRKGKRRIRSDGQKSPWVGRGIS